MLPIRMFILYTLFFVSHLVSIFILKRLLPGHFRGWIRDSKLFGIRPLLNHDLCFFLSTTLF
jgi:hypothetical protein